MPYKHFTQNQIIAIEIYIKEGFNLYQISKKLQKSHSSVYRIVNKYKSKK